MKRVSFLLLICFVVLSWFYGGALLEHQLAAWSVLSLSLLISAALFKASAMDFLFLGIGFWVVLSGMASEVPHDTQRAVFRLGIPLLAYVAARWSLSEEKDYRELLGGCVAVGACISLYGWGQTAGFFDASFWADPSYPAGRYVNHNHWAGYLELLIPVGVSLALLDRDWRQRLLWSGCVLVLLASHLASLSRAGILSLAGGLVLGLFSFLLSKREHKTGWKVGMVSVGAVLLIVCALGALASVKGPWRDRFESGRETKFQSVRERVEIWRGAIEIAKRHPLLGAGPGTFGSAYTAFMPRHTGFSCQHAHNEWLQAGAEGGVPLLLLFLVLPALWVREGLRTLHGSNRESAFRIGVLSSLAAGGLHSCVDLNGWFPAQLFLIALLCAALTSGRKDSRTPAPWMWRLALLIPLGSLLVLGWAFACGGRIKREALDAKDSLRWEKSLNLLEKASRLRPYDGDLFYERALIWRMRSMLPFRPGKTSLSRAEKELRRAVSVNPYHFRSWLLLCEVAGQVRGRREAESLYEEVQERFPTSPYPCFRAGGEALRSGDLTEAASHFQKGFLLWPDPAALREAGGLWRDETGRPASLGMAEFLPGDKHPLRFLVIEALVAEGQWEAVERESRIYLQGEGFSPEAKQKWLKLFETHGGKERGVALLESLEGS